MTRLRRTTVSASPEIFRILEAEAKRRDVPFAALLREAVEGKAQALRDQRRPSLAVARSTDGRTTTDVTAEPIAEPPR
jgi:hypothetical protein